MSAAAVPQYRGRYCSFTLALAGHM